MTQPLKEKLETIRGLVDECLAELGAAAPIPKKAERATSKEVRGSGNNIALQIVNKIGDCDEAANIQARVLNQRGAEGRVLLPFYISKKYFNNAWLTSGDIEKVTSDLRVKIDIRNVSNHLVTYRKYLESNAARKSGQRTPYRMNRNGAKRFEEIISEESR